MIQNIAPQTLDITYEHREWNSDSKQNRFRDDGVCFYFSKQGLLTKQEDTGHPPVLSDIKDQVCSIVYLFSIEEQEYYLVNLTEIPSDYTFCKLRAFQHCGNPALGFAGMTAFHLYTWYKNTQFCGVCGTPLRHHASLRAMKCPSCGNEIFPRIAPAVIVAVTDGDRILMTRYNGREYTGYALIAGFIEIGETAEDTVAREVMEEAGLKVKNIRYYKGQPWGLASNLLLGFVCELDGSDQIRMDEDELSEAGWYHRSEIESREEALSLTSEMIQMFKENRL